MSERLDERGFRIWKESNLPQEVVPLSDLKGIIAQLEKALKYCQDDKVVMQNQINVLEAERDALIEENKELKKLLVKLEREGFNETDRLDWANPLVNEIKKTMTEAEYKDHLTALDEEERRESETS